jgi:hypothetical protein
VRLHRQPVGRHEWIELRGLPVTRPSRIAADLLKDHEDPEAVATVIADALRDGYEYPAMFADTLAPLAARFGLRRGDGFALLRWLLELVEDPDTAQWINEARSHIVHHSESASESPRTGSR